MITTVTLNAAIDKTYFVPSFQKEGINRVDSMYGEPGGKGNNVAKVLHTLGEPVTASGLVGGYNGKQISGMLDAIGVDHDFVQVDGESRQCLNIIDEKTDNQTEILESGPFIENDDWQVIKEKVVKLATRSEYVILSGSLPKGLADDSYTELTHEIGDRAKVILDTSGPALQQGLKAMPYMIKPNQYEIAEILGLAYARGQDILKAMLKWHESGIHLIVVSLGEEGALAYVEGDIYKISPANISAVNPVGSGDAFTAGMVAGLMRKFPNEEALQLAAACGAANALEDRAGQISLDYLDTLKKEIKIERWG